MKSYIIFGVGLAMMLASCGPVQPTMTPPTVTSAVVLPSATFTVAPSPTATSTPVPPTATPTSTATATATATQTSTPTITPTPSVFLLTQDFPPIPAGKGALIVVNHNSGELALDIGGKLYKIPGSGRMVIFLEPGRYNYSGTMPSFAGRTGTTEIVASFYVQQDYGQ